MRTEFGRGYTVCLLQFVFHEPRLTEDLILWAKMRMESPSLFTESDAVETWANGSTDHLYDLVTGARVPRTQRESAKRMAAAALDCGHGFRRHNWTEKAARSWLGVARELLRLAGDPSTIEEAEAIDRSLGLRPERGITCAKPMALRRPTADPDAD